LFIADAPVDPLGVPDADDVPVDPLEVPDAEDVPVGLLEDPVAEEPLMPERELESSVPVTSIRWPTCFCKSLS
jgi:hypothetical protein